MMAMAEWVKTIGMSTHLAVATFLRLVLIAYGQQQDMMMEVCEDFCKEKIQNFPGEIHGRGL